MSVRRRGRHFVTFGQNHVHSVDGKTLDRNCVAVLKARTWEEGRRKAFEYFGDKFSFSYHGDEWIDDNMKYFPRGYIELF
jgi:hypothetical protein